MPSEGAACLLEYEQLGLTSFVCRCWGPGARGRAARKRRGGRTHSDGAEEGYRYHQAFPQQKVGPALVTGRLSRRDTMRKKEGAKRKGE